MKKRSIHKEFSFKLIIATTLFTIVMSFLFYGFTKATIYEDVTEKLQRKASIIYRVNVNSLKHNKKLKLLVTDDISVDLVKIYTMSEITFKQRYDNKGNHFIELFYPFDLINHTFIKLSKNIHAEDMMLKKIFSNIFILSIAGFVMVVLYALIVSRTLLFPIINISNKLSNMNEKSFEKINEKRLPIEFVPLAKSINYLTKKMNTYVKQQKEIFIGAAHELKTPLAVIKLKSEVTLIKARPIEKYEESLRVIINEINGLDKMITSILDMGRQEGTQLEKAIKIDIISFLKEKIKNYTLLGREKNITIEFICDLNKHNITIQITLLNQILQNFVQNAIKFTKNESTITIKVININDFITIEVIDEGMGIPENVDLFAPFKRVGNHPGTGLGLYLSKNSSDFLGASIDIQNRSDGIQGAVAKLSLASNPNCELKNI